MHKKRIKMWLSIQNYSNARAHNPQSKLATTFGSKKENVMLQFVRLENWWPLTRVTSEKTFSYFFIVLFNKVEPSKKFPILNLDHENLEEYSHVVNKSSMLTWMIYPIANMCYLAPNFPWLMVHQGLLGWEQMWMH
jgi:hypothetical protein